MLENFVPPYNATAYEKLGIECPLLGKTNMDEFAMGSTTENSAFHVTCNPRDTDLCARRLLRRQRAACVAAGEAPFTLGTRYRRLHPPACGFLRRGGHEAHLRRRQPLRAGGLCFTRWIRSAPWPAPCEDAALVLRRHLAGTTGWTPLPASSAATRPSAPPVDEDVQRPARSPCPTEYLRRGTYPPRSRSSVLAARQSCWTSWAP